MSIAKEANKRGKRKQMSLSSDEDSEMDDEPVFDSGNAESSDTSKDALMESMSSMSEEEINRHLKLCMKLSNENKINMKNAFGLHLIGMMKNLVKKAEKTDIQQASLSLQASSKIFAGRVEALYKDTLSFHGHLQSIVSDGKKGKKNDIDDEADGDNDPDGAEKERIKSQKNKCKSFLKTEESLDFDGDMPAPLIGEPHGNFSALNLAFNTSRLNPKLVSTLQLSSDSCALKCAIPEKCFKVENQLTPLPFKVIPKLEGLLEKLKKLDVSQSQFQTLLAASNTSESRFTLNISTPRAPSSPASLFNDNDADVFLAPPDVASASVLPRKSEDIEYTREKFDVMNITAEMFVNDIAAAVTNDGLDQRLLAPNSTVKKVLDKSRRSSIRPSEGRSTKKKVKEPFFAGKSAKDNKHLFVKGNSTCISQKVLAEWNIEATSNIDLGYELLENMETRKEDLEYAATLDEVLRVIKQNDLHYNFKYYFNKLSQVWKFSRRKLCLEDSFPGSDFANQTEKRMGSLGGGALNNPESLALSFQNLSIHDSIHEELRDSGGKAPDSENVGDLGPGDDLVVSDSEDQVFDMPESFETDIEQLMVKPPELVRPSSMKYDKRPVNLNTEKIKDLMWKIISHLLEVKNSSEKFVLFSAVYEQLKVKLEREISEFISMQFAFVVLLILANQKVLLIENVNDNTDLSITQDISETGAIENM